MKEHKKAICYVIGLLLIIALLVYLIYGKKGKKSESGYLHGSYYLTPKTYPPLSDPAVDPFPNFPYANMTQYDIFKKERQSFITKVIDKK